MKIIKIHYKVSKPVKSWKEIKKDAEEMKEFLFSGKFEGFYNKAYAVAHCQVSETPYAFFVVAGECVTDNPKMGWYKMFESQVIINPRIIDAPLNKILGDGKIQVPNTIEYNEPCLSFPFRRPKRVTRFDEITVEYQVKGRLWGFRTVKTKLTGIASEIFQHEYDHTIGKNIYFESEKPVKWWELLGNKKPVGGVSLDQFDPTGMTPAKEKEL